jgi:hypothetical protein
VLDAQRAAPRTLISIIPTIIQAMQAVARRFLSRSRGIQVAA